MKEIYELARQIEAAAFDIPPPNQHTPRIVQLAQAIQRMILNAEREELEAEAETAECTCQYPHIVDQDCPVEMLPLSERSRDLAREAVKRLARQSSGSES